jgi:glutathione S-transferase
MYTLYIGNKNYSSWSLRPWALLRELGIPFSEKLMVFDHGGSWDSFRHFSPTGQVPCLVDGETVVWDSLGISEYLAERHKGVWPADGAARTWARCVAAEMHSGFGVLRDRCTMNVGIRVRLNEIPPALARDIARLNELWNEGLSRFGGPFLAGSSFSAVDAFFTAVAFRVQTYDLKLDKNAAAYAARLLGLPSLQAWQTAALAETWREPDHEAEAIRAGTWIEDRRAKPA